MSQKSALLAEPVEICKFWKNRQRRIAIVVALREFEGHALIDCREYFTDKAGCMRPSTKSLSMVVRRLPELSRALRLALEKARALNLLPDGSDE
ncbi:MAG TPA: PC4/YdbC family ssDNA-binding protein [Chthoniobacterales bacterium]